MLKHGHLKLAGLYIVIGPMKLANKGAVSTTMRVSSHNPSTTEAIYYARARAMIVTCQTPHTLT